MVIRFYLPFLFLLMLTSVSDTWAVDRLQSYIYSHRNKINLDLCPVLVKLKRVQLVSSTNVTSSESSAWALNTRCYQSQCLWVVWNLERIF